MESTHWLVGSDSVRGRPIERQDSVTGRVVPHPQSESRIAPEIHGREEKHREKEKNTKTGEILVSEESRQTADNPRLMMSSERDGKVDSIYQTSLQKD